MVDRIKPLKIESPDSGGTQTDDFPTSVNKNEDFLDCRGVTVQDDSSDDDLVRISRDGDDLTFLDKNNAVKTLSQLLAGGGITADQHKTLRQLIHFIDDGPAEGFDSGAYREILPAGNPFPTSVTWYVDDTKAEKIVEKTISYTGAFPTTITWKVYDTDGSSVLATVTDTITYSGPFEVSRERAIA